MKTLVCLYLAILAFVAVNAVEQPLSKKAVKGPRIVVDETNMNVAMTSFLLNAVNNAYDAAADNKTVFVKEVADELTATFSDYYWSVLYDCLAYSTQQTYYAELTLNDKDDLYVHGITK